jgi:EAL domain-containing protein (putative c-di-GMP-specific phosphodiesterase class I)
MSGKVRGKQFRDMTTDEDLSSFIATSVRDRDDATGVVRRALQVIRSHLDLQVAYVSEFVDGRSVFREVDAPGLEALIKVGDSQSLDDVYCRHILEGRLPQLMPDTALEPVATAMPITAAVPIGAHLSVPIRLADGRTYGMFCCPGPKADATLNKRDLQMMRAFADLAAYEIDRQQQQQQEAANRLASVRAVLDEEQLSIVHQPIVGLSARRTLGFECLSRFSAEPARGPDVWYAEADAVGLREEMEIAAIRLALASQARLPAGLYTSINASPATILTGAFLEILEGYRGEDIVIEVTENANVDDYDFLAYALEPLRSRGIRLAVDDAGAGYASMQHILQLRPDIIKLDMSLTRDIDRDRPRRALADALIGFAHDTGSVIIAEGVETEAELKTLADLGVDAVQGYLTGRPQPLDFHLTPLAASLLAMARGT